MKLKIDADDLVLFGSVALFAIGAAFVTAASSGNGLLSFGVALIVFGVPTAFIAFMAAGQETK
jgi:hypothetical protein